MRYVKHMIGFALILILMTTGILNALTENEDKPANGIWNFDMKEVWRVDNAGGDILVSVVNIIVDTEGNIYLLDRKQRKIFVFNGEGKFLFAFGRQGEGPGEFKDPQALFLVKDTLILQDIGNEIKLFTKKGTFKTSFRSGENIKPQGFLDEHRYITIRTGPESQQKKETVEIYDMKERKGTLLTEIAAAKAVEASTNSRGEQVTIGIKDPNFTPTVIMTLKNNKIYLGRNQNYVIEKLDLKGKQELSFAITGRKRKPISLSTKEKYVERLRIGGGKQLPPPVAKAVVKSIPDECTYFEKILVDEKGLIYVYVTDFPNPGAQGIDIFSPEGKYLYHAEIKLPQGLSIIGSLVLHGDHLFAFVESQDEEDRELIKFKIKTPR